MADGGRLLIQPGKGTFKIGGATVLKADVAASNGLIHVIDTVLIPKEAHMSNTCIAGALATILAAPALAPAQTATGAQPPAQTPAIVWQVRNTTRVESWRFFEPRPGGGDPDSAFVANRLLVGVTARRPRLEFGAALQYVQFAGLPSNAQGPGPLGTGALYYDLARRTDSRQVYLKALHLTVKHAPSGLRVQAGRFGFTSGAESPSGDAQIETVKRQRVDARLIGEFEWSLYQRAYDGVRADVDRPRWHVSASVLRPTQGGFEDQAGAPLNDVWVTAASLSMKPGAVIRRTDLQAFVYRYADERPVRARPDNTFRSAAAVDVHVTSAGATLVGAYPWGPGQLDTLAWAVWQTGDWYGQDHRAAALAVEAGYQWTSSRARPWLRAGLFRGTGDEDAADSTHGTFFQMLPTSRKYAFSTAYNLMNLTDVFAQVQARPHANLGVRMDAHRLRLTRATDLWYSGSGASTRDGTSFGFAGRRANGSNDLGWIVEGAADWTVSRHLSVNGYLGRMSGGAVVGRLFQGTRLTFGYVEGVITY